MDPAQAQVPTMLHIPRCEQSLGPLSTAECAGALDQITDGYVNGPEGHLIRTFSLNPRVNPHFRLPKIFVSGDCLIGVDIGSMSDPPKSNSMTSWSSVYEQINLLVWTCVSLSEIGPSSGQEAVRSEGPALGGLLRTEDMLFLVANSTMGRDFERCAMLRLNQQTEFDLVHCLVMSQLLDDQAE